MGKVALVKIAAAFDIFVVSVSVSVSSSGSAHIGNGWNQSLKLFWMLL